MIKGQAINIICDRQEAVTKPIGGHTYQVVDDAYISINTAGGNPLRFDFGQKWTPPLPIKQADEIAANVAKLMALEKNLEAGAAASSAHLELLDQAVGKSAADNAANVAAIAENKYWTTLFWKPGNNGQATCDAYCRSDHWPPDVGSCVGARLDENGSTPNAPWSCGEILNQSGGDHLSCLCMKF